MMSVEIKYIGGVKRMMMITNLKPRIQNTRMGTPNGQGKIQTRRILSLVINEARKWKRYNTNRIDLKKIRYNEKMD